MLEVQPVAGRDSLKRYFYGGKSYVNLVMIIVIVITACSKEASPTVLLAVIVSCIIIKVVLMFQNFGADEVLYDRILGEDVEYLRNRSVKTMGLIEEEFSLIDPITAIGFASNDAIKMGIEITAEKKNLLQQIWGLFKSLLTVIPRKIYNFYLAITGNYTPMSSSIFFEGRDGKVRSSLVSFTLILFTEKQVVSYTCNYDIALGTILEEYVREIFYRDIDSVNYGDNTLYIITADGKFKITQSTNLRLAVPSRKDIVASMLGETDILENQVMAMKSLIRSKKEEMS